MLFVTVVQGKANLENCGSSVLMRHVVSMELLIAGLSAAENAEVEVDRKNLSDLAIHDPAAFAELVEIANKANAN